MTDQRYFGIVIIKEKLSNDKPVYVAHCTLGITSQGNTIEEATQNIKEAINLYLEEFPEKMEECESDSPPTFSFIEVNNAKTANSVRP